MKKDVTTSDSDSESDHSRSIIDDKPVVQELNKIGNHIGKGLKWKNSETNKLIEMVSSGCSHL